MTDVLVKVLDQNYVTKAVTGGATHVTVTDELGAVGDAEVKININDPIVDSLPDPDSANPYEGRFEVYEDDEQIFSGVIDARSIDISESDASVTFSGKQRGILLGYYNLSRVDYIGWQVPELYRELLRDNVAKHSAIYSVSSEDETYNASSALGGDPFKANYWKSTTSTGPHVLILDLGMPYDLTALRVMPQWWKDPDSNKFHWHKFTVETSLSPDSGYTVRGTKSDDYPASAKGYLYEFAATSVRYVRLTVTDSTDGFCRIAQLMVYRDIAPVGGDTTYITPFVENDDSGNCTTAGSTSRPIVPGAFQGDDVITHSYVTKLAAGGSITQTFRGTSTTVFFTQHDLGTASAQIFLDGISQGTINIPNNSYGYNGFEVGDLSLGVHTLKISQVSGTPQVDYFNGLYETSWRVIEDDDESIGYTGTWASVQGNGYFNLFAAKGASGDRMRYTFKGDRIRIMGSKTSDSGSFEVKLDGASQGTFSATGSGDKQVLFEWNGSYGNHELLLTVSSGVLFFDRLEGNFAHTLYIRARYETNLTVLTRMSEILDSYLRFNNDGSVDLLGSVGAYGGTIIREGENEGGNMIQGSAKLDYSQTGSVCLALVNVNGDMPIKALVVDYDALKEIGYKIIKLENSDAADQFLLNRQALTYLRDHRKPGRSYDLAFDPSNMNPVVVGETTILYSPSARLNGDKFRVGKIVTEYES